MRKIAVDTFPITPTFKTATAAINHAMNYPPLKHARERAKCAIGSAIADGFWTDCDFVLQFENGVFLHIFVGQEMKGAPVEWSFSDESPTLMDETIWRLGSEATMLQFASGPYVMDISAMLASRIGKPLKDVFVNELYYYVYTPRQLILNFGRVYDREANRNILYLFEDD